MQDLNESKEKFEVQKRNLKSLTSEINNEVQLPNVNSKDFIFNHKVTGDEMNNFTVAIQHILTELGNTDIKVVKQFEAVYNTLDTLDREYLNSIVGNIKTVEALSNDIKKKTDLNTESIFEIFKGLVEERNARESSENKYDELIDKIHREDKVRDKKLKEREKKDKEHDKAIEEKTRKDKEQDKLLKEQEQKDIEHDKAIEASVEKDKEQDLVLKSHEELFKQKKQKDEEQDLILSEMAEINQKQGSELESQKEKDKGHDKAIEEINNKIQELILENDKIKEQISANSSKGPLYFALGIGSVSLIISIINLLM